MLNFHLLIFLVHLGIVEPSWLVQFITFSGLWKQLPAVFDNAATRAVRLQTFWTGKPKEWAKTRLTRFVESRGNCRVILHNWYLSVALSLRGTPYTSSHLSQYRNIDWSSFNVKFWVYTHYTLPFTKLTDLQEALTWHAAFVRLNTFLHPNVDSWMANLIFGLHHISSHEMPNVCLFDLSPRSEEYNDWLTAGAKGKERVSGERAERLIERKAIIRLILHFLVGSASGNWNCATCQQPIGAPFSEINKPKINR